MTARLLTILAMAGRIFLLGAMSLVFGIIVLVLIGRQTVSQVDELRENVESFLVDNIGLQVEIGELAGEWPRLVPIIDIATLRLKDDTQRPSIVLTDVRAELDLFRTLRHLNVVWRELTINDLSVVLVEDSNGNWNLRGFERGSDTELEVLLKPFIHSRLINLEQIQIEFQAFSGQVTRLKGASVKVENDDSFHRSEMSLSFGKQTVPAYLVLEGYGNPMDHEFFSAQAYLKVQDFDISEPLVALGKSLAPEILKDLKYFSTGLNSEIWVDIQPGGSLDFEGSMSMSELPLDWFSNSPPIKNISSDITGWYIPSKDWGFRLQGLDLEWGNNDIKPLDMLFSQRLTMQWYDFDVSMNHLNLTLLSDLVQEANVISDGVLKTLDQLRPRGDLSVLTFGHNQSGYFASANLSNVDIEPFMGIPGIRGVNGYIEIEGDKGLFHIDDEDGFSLAFPKIYTDYLPIQQALGTVYVHKNVEEKTTVLRSSVIDAKMEAGDASFLFSVKQDNSALKIAPTTTLLVGGSNINAKYSNQYIPYTLSPSLTQWLQASNLSGNVKQFGLLKRSGPGVGQELVRTTQLLFDVEAAGLDYHPQWLGLRDFDATVVVDDTVTLGQVSRGTLGGANVINAGIEIGNSKLGEPKSNLLRINANLDSSVSQAINILAKSSLASNIGSLASWDYGGQLKTALMLQIPLKTADGISATGNYEVLSTLQDAQISIPNSPIVVADINGAINFSTTKGLYSEAITGRFWQQPIVARLFKKSDDQNILFSTSIKPDNLNRLVDFPWSKIVSGMIPLEGLLKIKPLSSSETDSKRQEQNLNKISPVTLTVKSQLVSNGISLPVPLGKEVGEIRKLALKLHFDSGLARIEGTLGDHLVSDLRFIDGRFHRGVTNFDRTLSLPEENIMLVGSYLETTDIDSWRPVIDLFSGDSEESERAWHPVFDLKFDYLEWEGLYIQDIRSQTKILAGDIALDFFSELADGHLLVNMDSQRVPSLHLTRLSISDSFLKEKIKTSVFDPRKLTALDFSVDSLFFNGKRWGNLAFDLRPQVSGAKFGQIKGDIFGLKVSGSSDNEQAEFFWGFDDEKNISQLKGSVTTQNIGDLFSGLNLPIPVDSQSGDIFFNLQWPDNPWSFSKKNLAGNFEIELNQGSFYSSSVGTNPALKLFSLFNFANWLRRLKLDFSDVVGEHLAFNNLQGSIYLDQGNARMLEPLIVKMPSGRMSLAGDFDLLAETADAQLVVTLPVATNLPWVVALLGGIPAAAGVYITSKLVSKQVDRLSSISYKINGLWDDLEVSVDKIFAAQLEVDSSLNLSTVQPNDD